jgi:lysophospholipase L1-like esterase
VITKHGGLGSKNLRPGPEVTQKMTRRWLLNTFLVVVALLISLGTLEGGLRVIYAKGMQYDIEMWKYAKQLKEVAPEARIGHRHIQNSSAFLMGVDVRINSNGLRDNELDYERKDGELRVLMLGDSLTFGWGVTVENTVAERLEALLDEAFPGRRVEVINGGVGNYNTSMEVAWFLSEGIRYEPEVVILNYFINDAEPTPKRKGGFLAENFYAYVFLAGKADSILRKYLNRVNWREYYRLLYDDEADGWQQAAHSINELAGFCEKNSIELRIVNYPELRELENYPFADVTEKIRSLARVHRVPFLDLLPAARVEDEPDLWVTREDPHPNGRANELFARAIFDWLAADRDRWVTKEPSI